MLMFDIFCKHVINDHSNEEDNAQVNDLLLTSLSYAKKQLNMTKNIMLSISNQYFYRKICAIEDLVGI